MKRTAVLFLAVVAIMVGLLFTAQAAVAQTMLSGYFVTIWPDAQGGEQPPLHYLIDRSGKWIELEVGDAVKGLRSLDRKQVTVEGSYEESLAATTDALAQKAQAAEPRFRVRAILPDKESFAPMATEMTAQAAIIGSKPWVTILCRFADSTATTPRERPWFDGLMTGSGYPSMDHFWRELSYGQTNFSGSQVFGWYNLQHPLSHYVFDTNGDGVGDPDLGRLAEDCAAVADAEVYFPQYAGIDFVFNEKVGCCAWGGATWLILDGVGQMYGTTWLPPWALSQTTVAHERGHAAIMLPHSSGPYNTAYDSRWDPMSGACGNVDQAYGCIGVHTISFHKEMAGWIPSGKIYTAAPGSSVTVEIERLAQPAGNGYLMVKIPINGSTTEFYTVETRQRVGYDSPLPDNTVLIHHVDTANRWDRQAQVVDVDNNGDPNDAAAMWLPGETFTDANGISVSVVSATANGFLVTVSNGSAPPPPPTQFTLAVSKSGNGTVIASGINCGSDCQESFSDSAVVSLSAYPDAGWAFASWSGDADCADGQVTMSRDIACHAEFVSIPPPEPRPNLSGWFWSLAKTVKKGHERVSFTFFANNSGVLPIHGPFIVAFYISDDATLDWSDAQLVVKWVKNKKGLAPGSGVKLKGKKIALPVSGSGKYLLAVLDPWNNEVPESDEQDNVVAIPIP